MSSYFFSVAVPTEEQTGGLSNRQPDGDGQKQMLTGGGPEMIDRKRGEEKEVYQALMGKF